MRGGLREREREQVDLTSNSRPDSMSDNDVLVAKLQALHRC